MRILNRHFCNIWPWFPGMVTTWWMDKVPWMCTYFSDGNAFLYISVLLEETKKNNLLNIGQWLSTADLTTKVCLKKAVNSSAFLMARHLPQTAWDAKDLTTPSRPPTSTYHGLLWWRCRKSLHNFSLG